MSLVVDLALQIVCPKLSAHATLRRDCGTCPGDQGTPGQTLLPIPCDVPLHDSGGNHGSAQAYAALDVPADRRSPMGGASSCVNHAVSHWNVKLGSHNNNTRSRHHRAREVADCVALTLSLFLFSWPSLTGVASSALGIAYAACTRAGDVPESLQNYRTTTARSLDVSMRYIASKHKPRPATSVCRPSACYSLCRHTLHTLQLQYTVHAQGTAIYTQLSRQSTSSIRYPGRSPGFHGRMPGLPCSTIPAPSLLLRSLPRRTSGRCPACIPTGRGPLSMSDCGPRLPTTCGIAMSSAMEVRL
jgi:hypothetical protein